MSELMAEEVVAKPVGTEAEEEWPEEKKPGALRTLWNSRELVLSLTQRDIRSRYKQSVLGITWALLQPLALMAIYTVVVSRILGVKTGSIPYPIFAYTALLPWTFHSQSLSTGTECLVSNFNLITKIYFPREAFPIAAVLGKTVDLALGVLVLIPLFGTLLGPIIWFIPSMAATILHPNLAAEYPAANRGWSGEAQPLIDWMFGGDFRDTLLMMFAAIGLVLLLACVNIANLLLARSAARQREIAIRLSLGATRGRLLRQMITESLLLAGAGGLLGLALARPFLQGILAVVPPYLLPPEQNIAINGMVLGFTCAVSLLTGLLFGLAPAWLNSQPALATELKDSARGTTGGRARRRNEAAVDAGRAEQAPAHLQRRHRHRRRRRPQNPRQESSSSRRRCEPGGERGEVGGGDRLVEGQVEDAAIVLRTVRGAGVELRSAAEAVLKPGDVEEIDIPVGVRVAIDRGELHCVDCRAVVEGECRPGIRRRRPVEDDLDHLRRSVVKPPRGHHAGSTPPFSIRGRGAALHDLDRDLEVLAGRRHEPADALDGLGNERRRLPRGRGADELVEVARALHAARRVGQLERAAVAVRRQRVLDRRDLGRHRAPRRVRGERLREHRAARVAVTQRDDLGAPGVHLRQRHRGLVRFGAARREVRLLELPGRDRDQRGPQLRNAAHGGALCALRQPPWPRIRRRTAADRSSLLHQFRIASLCARRSTASAGLWTIFAEIRGALKLDVKERINAYEDISIVVGNCPIGNRCCGSTNCGYRKFSGGRQLHANRWIGYHCQ